MTERSALGEVDAIDEIGGWMSDRLRRIRRGGDMFLEGRMEDLLMKIKQCC